MEASAITTLLAKQSGVPFWFAHQGDRFFGADPTRRALPATFVLEEAHQVERNFFHVVVPAEYHDGGGADEAAVFLQGVKIQGQVGL